MATCRILSPGEQRDPMNAAMMLAQPANRDEWFVQANRWRFQNVQADPDCRDSAYHGNSLLRKPELGDRRNANRRNRTATDDCGSSTRRSRQVAYENIETQKQPLEGITFQLPLLRLPLLLPWGLLIRSDMTPPVDTGRGKTASRLDRRSQILDVTSGMLKRSMKLAQGQKLSGFLIAAGLLSNLAFSALPIGIANAQDAGKKVILSPNAPNPIGPYSQGIQVGKMVYLAGQGAIDPKTNQPMANASIEDQTRRTLDNLKAVLEADGLTMDHIVSTTVFLKDMNEFGKMNEVYATYFKDAPPARATVEVARLPRDLKVEISAIAVRP